MDYDQTIELIFTSISKEIKSWVSNKKLTAIAINEFCRKMSYNILIINTISFMIYAYCAINHYLMFLAFATFLHSCWIFLLGNIIFFTLIGITHKFKVLISFVFNCFIQINAPVFMIAYICNIGTSVEYQLLISMSSALGISTVITIISLVLLSFEEYIIQSTVMHSPQNQVIDG